MTTQLPTKTEYEQAIDELKKLNEDLFYDDFKEKIKGLESNLLQLAMSSTTDFKMEADNLINQASLLFHQMETQKQEIRDLLETSQSETVQRSQEFLEEERARLLSVYEELSTSNDKNRQFLEQNEAFVKLSNEQLALMEEKIAAHMKAFQQMEVSLKELHESYKEMFHKHTESIKSIMVVREEALMDKVSHQLEIWSTQQSEQDEEMKRDLQQWQEQVDSAINSQHNKSHKMLESFSNKISSKEDLAKIEKKNALKMNVLLSVVVIEAILIGIKFFM